MKRVFKKAVIPTETLLGCSSDESDSYLDDQESDGEHPDTRSLSQTGQHPVAKKHEAAVRNDAAHLSNEPSETDDRSNVVSPPVSVRCQLGKRRSVHKHDLRYSEKPSRSERLSASDPDADGVTSMPSSAYRVPSVEDALESSNHAQHDGQKDPGCCVSPVLHDFAPVTQPPRTPVTLKGHVTTRDSGLELGSSLSSDSNTPSKRTSFNERVEVRTSPTYWQREHSDNDESYTKYRHEQYHEDLRDGKKALPLKDPLRDPDGYSARHLRFRRNSIDEECFNSWSTFGARNNASADSTFGYSASFLSSNANQPHRGTLHTAEGYQPEYHPRPCSNQQNEALPNSMGCSQPYFDETRPNPNNRQYQPYNGNNYRRSQGKENQTCPLNHVSPESTYISYGPFGGHRGPEESHTTDQFFQHNDGSSAKQTGFPWHQNSSHLDHNSQAIHTNNYFESCSRCPEDQRDQFYGDCQDNRNAGFDMPFAQSDQDLFPGDCGYHWDDSDSSFDYQQKRQDCYSRATDGERNHYNAGSTKDHVGFGESQPRSHHGVPGRSTDQGSDSGHDTPYYNIDVPFESSSKIDDVWPTRYEPKLPPVGVAMEIPDDMSDNDVHTLLIPGCDDYVRPLE
ncbi:hypothetical protein EsH8_VI_000622 [Colletotrichum jinshuiense]